MADQAILIKYAKAAITPLGNVVHPDCGIIRGWLIPLRCVVSNCANGREILAANSGAEPAPHFKTSWDFFSLYHSRTSYGLFFSQAGSDK